MALRSTTVQVPIRGLSTQANAENAIPGDADVIENMHARLFSATTGELVKRNGTTSYALDVLGGGTITNARKTAKFGSEELLVTDTGLYSWSSIAGAWVFKGNLTPAALSTKFVASTINSTARTLTDGAIGGGYYCGLSNSGGTVLVTVIDLSSGTTVLNDSTTTAGAAFNGTHVVALSDRFMIITATNAGTFKALSVTYAAPSTISAATVIATNGSVATARWAVARNGTTDQVLIAYNGDAANRLRAVLWNSNMTSAGSFLFAEQPDGAICWLHHDYSDGKAYIAYVDSTRGTKLLDVTLSGFTAGSASLIDGALLVGRNITGYHQQGPVNTLFVEVAGTQTYYNQVKRSTGGAFATWQRGAGLRSSIFKVASTYYVGVAYEDGLQDKYFVLNASDTTSPPQVIATALDGEGSGLSALASWLSAVPAISSTVVALPVEKFEEQFGPVVNGTAVYGAVYLQLDFAPTGLSSPKQIGGSLMLPGAIVRMYDGVTTTEAGFLVAPIVRNGSSIPGAGNVPAGTYEVIAIYVYEDGQGQAHRSPPSDPYTLVVAAVSIVAQVDVTNCRIGDKGSRAWIDLYYTAASGTTYYSRTAGGGSTGADFLTIPVADLTSANQGEELYTTGDKFPHSAVPPASLLEVFRNRLFLSGTDASNELWVSDEVLPGAGVSMSDQLVIEMQADDGGEISAMAEMEDRLVLFKEKSIYHLNGQGPSLNGDGQYEQPARLEADLGSANQLGVTKTKEGLVFKSLKGIYLLTRGLQLVFIGAEVQVYGSLTLTSGTVPDDLAEVRLTTSEGRTLVYHTEWKNEAGIGRWSTFTGQAAIDSAVWGGQWVYLASNGTVHVEVDGQWADDGAPVQALLSIGWMNLAGLFAEFALWEIQLLLKCMGTFTLNAAIAIDLIATTVQSLTLACTTATPVPVAIEPLHQSLRSLYLTLSESSTTEGFRISGLALDVGVEGRIKTTAPSARMT